MSPSHCSRPSYLRRAALLWAAMLGTGCTGGLLPLMVQSLQNTGAFDAVLQAPSSAIGALRLDTELLHLQHEHTSSPSVVRLTLRAVLLDTATRKP